MRSAAAPRRAPKEVNWVLGAASEPNQLAQPPCVTPHDVEEHGVLLNASSRFTPSSTHHDPYR